MIDSRPERDATSDTSDHARLHLRLGIALLAIALTSTILVVAMLSQRPHMTENISPVLLPVGQFKGLATFQTPSGTIDTNSRFVVEAEGASGTGSGTEYWYAYPKTSTGYQINGVQVEVSEFGRRLAKMPPILVDVDASVAGKLDRVNAVYPRGAPQ